MLGPEEGIRIIPLIGVGECARRAMAVVGEN